MRIERLVFVGSFEVTRHVRRRFRVSVWRRVRGSTSSEPVLWSPRERALMAEAFEAMA